jgi:hypothetical protein
MKKELKNFILKYSIDTDLVDSSITFEDIKGDWEIKKYWEVEDWRNVRMRCLCEKSTIKKCYTIQNIINGKILEPIGSSCITTLFPNMIKEKEYVQQKYIWDTQQIMGNYLCVVCQNFNDGDTYNRVCKDKTCIETYFKRVSLQHVCEFINMHLTHNISKNLFIVAKNIQKKKEANILIKKRLDYEKNLYIERLTKLKEIVNNKRLATIELGFNKIKQSKNEQRYILASGILEKVNCNLKEINENKLIREQFEIWKTNVAAIKKIELEINNYDFEF